MLPVPEHVSRNEMKSGVVIGDLDRNVENERQVEDWPSPEPELMRWAASLCDALAEMSAEHQYKLIFGKTETSSHRRVHCISENDQCASQERCTRDHIPQSPSNRLGVLCARVTHGSFHGRFTVTSCLRSIFTGSKAWGKPVIFGWHAA